MLMQPIAKNALTMLVNLSSDDEILKNLAEDDAFLETLLSKVMVCRCLASLLDALLTCHSWTI